MPTLQVALADDKAPTSPFASQVWRGVRIESRHSKAHELAAMRELVDRLDATELAYAVESVWCDSNCCMYTVSLRPGARAPWRYLEAQVQAWLDADGRTASIEGEAFESDWLQGGGDPEDEDAPRRYRLAEDARTLLLGPPSVVRARMVRRLVEDLEAALEAA